MPLCLSDRTRYRTRLREHYLNCRPQEAGSIEGREAMKGGEGEGGGEIGTIDPIYIERPSRDSIDDKISHEQSP